MCLWQWQVAMTPANSTNTILKRFKLHIWHGWKISPNILNSKWVTCKITITTQPRSPFITISIALIFTITLIPIIRYKSLNSMDNLLENSLSNLLSALKVSFMLMGTKFLQILLTIFI